MFREIGWHFARISAGALILVVAFYDPAQNLNQQKAIPPEGQPSSAYEIGNAEAQPPSAFHDQTEEQKRRNEKEDECSWSGPAGPCVMEWLDLHNGTVSALATLVIAGFTFSLATSTRRLWKAGEDQMRIAQFCARWNYVSYDDHKKIPEALWRNFVYDDRTPPEYTRST